MHKQANTPFRPRVVGAALALAFSATLSINASAAVSEQEAARLGKDLTPVGAEKAASKDGAVPAWDGGMTKVPAGWKPGRLDPYKDDKLLYSVDASNLDKHADKVPPGQAALIKAYKGYKLDVYPSHRSCPAPDIVAERTKKNATYARIGDDGWRLEQAYGAGVPFPIPKSGVEVLWNYKTRYTGLGRRAPIAALMPDKDGSIVETRQWSFELYPFNDPKTTTLKDVEGIDSKLLYDVLSPPVPCG